MASLKNVILRFVTVNTIVKMSIPLSGPDIISYLQTASETAKISIT